MLIIGIIGIFSLLLVMSVLAQYFLSTDMFGLSKDEYGYLLCFHHRESKDDDGKTTYHCIISGPFQVTYLPKELSLKLDSLKKEGMLTKISPFILRKLKKYYEKTGEIKMELVS